MKRLIVILSILNCYCLIVAQNLVKNPGFEEYYHLPDLQYEYGDRYLYKDYFICEYWHRIPGTTPDYYHINAKNKRYKIPYNTLTGGYHPALSDSAYLGFIPFDMTGSFEPISGELIKCLEAGKVYEISFDYRFSVSSSYFYLNKLECFISNNINWRNSAKPWDAYTDIITSSFKANVSFTDTLNNDGEWHKLKGYYTAQGGEAYISFGIFYQSDKLFKVINGYLGHNFILGDKDELEKKYMKKHQKELPFIHYNSQYSSKQEGTKIEVTMKAVKKKITSVIQERIIYYFIDNISVVEVDTP